MWIGFTVGFMLGTGWAYGWSKVGLEWRRAGLGLIFGRLELKLGFRGGSGLVNAGFRVRGFRIWFGLA